MRALPRLIVVDLRAYRGQAILIVLITAAITAALVLASAVTVSATAPWQRTFRQSHAAHIWIHTTPGTSATSLAHLPGVVTVAGPYPTISTTLIHAGHSVPLELRGVAGTPAVSRPLVRSGKWLSPQTPDGIVLERSLARSLWTGTGDHLTVRGADGTPHTLRVVGVADTADQASYPATSPGLAWIQPAELQRIEPSAARTNHAIGLRLTDPAATDFMAQRAVTQLGSDHVTRVTTWQEVRTEMEVDNRLLGVLLGVFGLAALAAVALGIAGAVGARVRAYLRDIAILKAIGVTPAQVIQIFLIEHSLLALLGIAAGITATEMTGPHLPGLFGDAMTVWDAQPSHLALLLVGGLGALLAIALATALPAWRAGQVAPIPTVRIATPGSAMSYPARLALLLRLPPALILGGRDALHHPTRAALTIGRLAVTMVLLTIALGGWSTVSDLRAHPERVGVATSMTARPTTTLPETTTRQLLDANPDITASYPGVETQALIPGQTSTITLRALGTSNQPYPYAIAAGRRITNPDEAVAGQRLLDILHIKVGDWIRITVNGTPHIFHIVGRSIELDHNGAVLSAGLDSLTRPGQPLNPQYYALTLRPHASPEAVRTAITTASHHRLDVEPVANPADALGSIRILSIGLMIVLVLIAVAELITATTSGIREHQRNLGALRAIGLTPRQVTAVLVTSTSLLALAGTLLGALLGAAAWSIVADALGRASGIGTNVARLPTWPTLLTVCAAAVALAAAVAALPATRAARAPATQTLRTAA
ncbi:hypothetical protein BIV57_04080 [Mangrovactinospora gilvigrisea]|uniref:Peptide ABC transporter permease n=1 Tax=Mangrovactinospora gilvigrisea TaxID=1428644 RepID=A0A1J7BJH4_9ACTN|nr:FtsX-like permease family protein [Mangrovactinospora gilvigrisea]OIV38733.1 hypothetical protein BIV57_04080 [Mangrovactinospora gilvigrisea]